MYFQGEATHLQGSVANNQGMGLIIKMRTYPNHFGAQT